METTPKCYSIAFTNAATSCSGCECAKWCKDSSDPKPIGGEGRDRVYCTLFEGYHSIVHDDQSESSELSAIMGELLSRLDADKAEKLYEFFACMSAMASKDASAYKVIVERLRFPRATFEELGKNIGMSKQTAQLAIQRAVDMVPVLQNALPFPKAKLVHNGERFSIRCSGGWLYVEADGAVVLKTNNNEENNKNLARVVMALNNMHWRKLNALLEDLV